MMEQFQRLVPPRYQVCAVFGLVCVALVVSIRIVNWLFSE